MFFASSVFLIGLALLTVPWWLHRLNAHEAEQRVFSSLFLMRQSDVPVNMRKRLQHVALLILRWLLLIAACLAFAEPIVELPGNAAAAGEPPAHRLLVFDASLSMGAITHGASPLEAAIAEARDIIDSLPGGAKAAIVTAAGELRLLAPLTDDRSLLRAALQSMETSSARLEVAGLMGRVAALGSTLLAPGERLEIHFLSDFQASGLPDQFNALIEGATWPVFLQPVADPGTTRPNRTIASLRLFERAGGATGRTLEASVRSFDAPGDDVEISLLRDGVLVDRQTLFVPENGSASTRFDVEHESDRARRPAAFTLRLQTEDSLVEDNVRHLVENDVSSTTLPVIAGSTRAWAYLRAAVNAGTSRFATERVEALNRPEAPVVVVLGQPSAAIERPLVRYLESGGAVFLAVDGDTRSAGRFPLLDLPITADRFQQAPRGVVAADRSHPALAGFRSNQDLTIFQAISVSDEADQRGEILLALDDGTPLLTEHRMGAGRLLLLGTALDPEWSTLVLGPFFVDFVTRLLGYLAEDLLPDEALVAQPFAIPAQNVQLFDAAGARVLGLGDTTGRPTVRLAEPGLYQLRTPSSARRLAVNVDFRESDLTTADRDQLAAWQRSASRIDNLPPAQTSVQGQPPPRPAAVEPQRQMPLAPWLLAVLAALVLLEPLFANLFTASGIPRSSD